MSDVELNDALTTAIATPSPVSTGAVPVDVGPDQVSIAVTTGGTQGTEIINLQLPDLNVSGWVNGEFIGRRVAFFLETLTDPADAVKITVDGNVNISVINDPGLVPSETVDGAILSTEGDSVQFLWVGDAWVLDRAANNTNDHSEYVMAGNFTIGNILNTDPMTARTITIHGGDSELSGGGNLTLRSGSPYADNKNAGNILLVGGDAYVTNGNGGGISLNAGAAADPERNGIINLSARLVQFIGLNSPLVVLMPDLPTADPVNAGQLWNDGGTLKVSAG